MPLRRVQVLVRGRVQGVGFRYFTLSVGRNLGLTGFVRNEPDGSVAAEAEGDPAAVDQFLLHIRQGPAHARVDAVQVEDLPATGAAGTFDVR